MPPYLASHSLSDRGATSYVAVEYGVHANRGLTVMTSTRDALFLLSLRADVLLATTCCACSRHERGVSTSYGTSNRNSLLCIAVAFVGEKYALPYLDAPTHTASPAYRVCGSELLVRP